MLQKIMVIIILVIPFRIFSDLTTMYVKICRATTGHVVGKCNLALVGFMNFVTNCFLYGLMAGALKTVYVGIYEEVEVYGGLWVGFYVGVCE